jgi:hypothetical protein
LRLRLCLKRHNALPKELELVKVHLAHRVARLLEPVAECITAHHEKAVERCGRGDQQQGDRRKRC